MNVAFKPLEAKLRFGELSIGQWAGVIAGVLLGLAFAQFVSPVGGLWGTIIGVYVGAIPASAALFASLAEFDLWRLIVNVARWQRSEGRHLPGPGQAARGYAVIADRLEPVGGEATDGAALDRLWALDSGAERRPVEHA
jgi:hypothetical protein